MQQVEVERSRRRDNAAPGAQKLNLRDGKNAAIAIEDE